MYEEGWCGGAATRSRKGKYLRSSSEEAGGSYRVPKYLDRKRGYRKMRNTTIRDEEGTTELMSGSGTLTWGSGAKYDGIWENEAPKGNGVFSWTDGSWCKDWSEDQQRLDDLCCSGIGVRRGLYGISSVKGFPRICVWESDGDDGDITCEIVDNADLPVSYFDRKTSGVGNELMYFSPSCFSDESEKKKKPGETIRKGHKNYDLMRSLQLGVRYILLSLEYVVV